MKTKKIWIGLEFNPGEYSYLNSWVVRRVFDGPPTPLDINNFLGHRDMIISVDCLVPPEPDEVDTEEAAANQGGALS